MVMAIIVAELLVVYKDWLVAVKCNNDYRSLNWIRLGSVLSFYIEYCLCNVRSSCHNITDDDLLRHLFRVIPAEMVHYTGHGALLPRDSI